MKRLACCLLLKENGSKGMADMQCLANGAKEEHAVNAAVLAYCARRSVNKWQPDSSLACAKIRQDEDVENVLSMSYLVGRGYIVPINLPKAISAWCVFLSPAVLPCFVKLLAPLTSCFTHSGASVESNRGRV